MCWHDGVLSRRNEVLPTGDGDLPKKYGGPNESPWSSNEGHAGRLIKRDKCQSGKDRNQNGGISRNNGG
jgi:hypothetical protein